MQIADFRANQQALRLTCPQSIDSVRQVDILLKLEGRKGQVRAVEVGEEDKHPQPWKKVVAAFTDDPGPQYL